MSGPSLIGPERYGCNLQIMQKLNGIYTIKSMLEFLPTTLDTLAAVTVNLRIAHLRIGYLVGNPESYQSSGLPTSIITLFFVLSGLFRVVSIDFGCFRMISMNPIY